MHNHNLTVRHAELDDIQRMLEIFDVARSFMAAHGNISQWLGGYPSRIQLESDIAHRSSYLVMTDEGVIAGTFYFYIGQDPTYGVIDGAWPNDDTYGTIHRMASAGIVHGIADVALRFALQRIANVRIDTHADNKVMQRWALTRGFTYCGIITLANGSPRLAYHFGC